MRTRSQSRNNFPQQEASPAIVEPHRIELPFLEDQFQEDPPEDPPEVPMAKLLQAPTEGYEDAIDSLNSATGGSFLDKMPRECLKIIESKSKVRQSRAKAVVAKTRINQSSAPSPTTAPVKAVEPNYVTYGGSGTLPSNTITNHKEDLKGITTRSGVAYQGTRIPTPSKVMKQGTEPVVAPVSALMPNLKPSIPYPSRRDNERRRDQANEQIEKFCEIFKDMSFEISFTDALIFM
nr:hypothetical protein [Tanacetum cinerariifolium]